MRKIDIKNNLKSALEKSTPDCFEKINKGEYVNEINFNIEDIKKNKKKVFNFNMRYAMAISACLFLMIVGFGTYYVPVNDIYLDVNPSIEIKTNMFDRVIVVNAKNDDGVSITNSIDIKNKNIEVAVDDIMNEMISQGYINSELKDNAILISVNAKSEEQAKKISDSIDESVNKKLSEKNISAVVMKQELNSMKDLQALSKETGVSVGKLQFIQKMIAQKNDGIDVNSLYNLKIKELLAYAEKNNISAKELVDDIEDFIDDIDDDDDDEDDEDDEDDDKDKNNKSDSIDKKDKDNKNNKTNNKNNDNDEDDDDDDDGDDDGDEDDNKIKDKNNKNENIKNTNKDKDNKEKNNKDKDSKVDGKTSQDSDKDSNDNKEKNDEDENDDDDDEDEDENDD